MQHIVHKALSGSGNAARHGSGGLSRSALRIAVWCVVGSMAASEVTAGDSVVPESVTWGLSKITVVDPGQTVYSDEGVLTQGYTLEAKSKTKDGKLIPEGTFRLTLTAFSPAAPMMGQEPGVWYVKGKWTVIDKYALDDEKHSRGVVSGYVGAELGFNPALDQLAWTAPADLPMSTVTQVTTDGLQWAYGDGVLMLDPTAEGELQLDLMVYPVLPVTE